MAGSRRRVHSVDKRDTSFAQQLRALRDPRAAVMRHLFNDTDPRREFDQPQCYGPHHQAASTTISHSTCTAVGAARTGIPPITRTRHTFRSG